MLKLPKGLKKKKGKKSKKDKELFNEEELEQYRREHQKQQQQQELNQENSEQPSTSNDEEWSKFLALTSGVDSILKQKQEDLDRIKSTSFFQRVPPPSEVKHEEELKQKEEEEKAKEEEELKKVEEAKKEEDILAEAVVELSESESEEEEADDIFDTAYIDVIASAEVGLVNVDSPTEEEEEGPDPFDTSYADKVIKGPEVSKRGKKLVSIGSAVEVLTGIVESKTTTTTKRPRRGPRDLLLETFDEVAAPTDLEPSPEPVRTLLDDPADEIPDIPIDLSVSLHLQFQKESEKQKQEEQEKEEQLTKDSILEEFDVIKNKNTEENDNDEFAQLAVESLSKKDEVSVINEANLKAETSGDWAFFTEPSKEKPPRPAIGPHIPAAVSDEDLSFQEDSSDPFDTAFVEKIIPATLAEDADFDPRAESPVVEIKQGRDEELFSPDFEGNLLTTKKSDPIDLLHGSNTDLSQLAHSPIAPTQSIDKEDNQGIVDDPFDTSAVDSVVAPGKTELKFLEKELLTESSNLKHSLSDPDFDPRAEEELEGVHQIDNQQSITTGEETASRKQSLVLNIQPVGSKLVSFLVPSTDLLKTDDHNSKVHQKPLTPYYTKNPILSEVETEEPDPFDTSFISEIKPTEVELNLLERDLLAESKLKHSLSDPDFDPRADSPKAKPVEETKSVNPDFLSTADIDFNSKVLTPATEERQFESSYINDPFDTSAIATNIQPGTTELKILVNEFIPNIETETDLFADTQESVFGEKALTPQQPIESTNSIEEVEIDPFDTSFASNIVPGQAEIRVIETELIHN